MSEIKYKDEERPTVYQAQYAKKMFAVSCPSDNSGWATFPMRAASEITKRYSHRENSYIMSKAQVRKFIKAIEPMKIINASDFDFEENK